jgi:hypothetical protein
VALTFAPLIGGMPIAARARGRKGGVNLDAGTGQRGAQNAHAAVAMPANVADGIVLPDLLHGNETRVWGD